MVDLNSAGLAKSYLNLVAIKRAIGYVQSETYRRVDDGFLNEIGFPSIGELPKNRKKFIEIKMDFMVSSINELIILGLVSDFEKIVFDRVKNASGEISKIVKQKYKAGPFNNFSTDFVKTGKDIDKLSLIKAIISPKLPEELSKKFTEVVELRNRLSHGKRFGKHSLMSFDDIAQTLDDILNLV